MAFRYFVPIQTCGIAAAGPGEKAPVGDGTLLSVSDPPTDVIM
jgi:hypothetical protein